MESLIIVLKVVAISYLLIAAVTLIICMLSTMIGFMVYKKSGGDGGFRESVLYSLDLHSNVGGTEIIDEVAKFKGDDVEDYNNVLNEDIERVKNYVKEMSQREVLWMAISPILATAIGWPVFSKTIASRLWSIKEGVVYLANM